MKNARVVTQAQNLTPTGFFVDTSSTVNYGVSCDSKDSVSEKASESAQRAILEIFLTLDGEGRRAIIEKLAAWI